MKINQLLIFLILPFNVLAQLSEHFSDGNFRSNPEWIGDTSYFKVDSLLELQSQGPAATSTISLSASNSRAVNSEWQFYVRMEFSPSATNYARFYLVSDQADCKGSLNGYYVKIGGISGTLDAIDLYRQEGSISTKILAGIPGNAGKNINTLRIKIIRDGTGKWTLSSDTTGGTQFTAEGTCTDTLFSSSSFCGMVCYHTSTRNNQFYFDDIEIKEAPLSILKVNPINEFQADIYFSRPVDSLTASDPSDYFISNGIGLPFRAAIDSVNHALVHLTLSNALLTGNYTITINHVNDSAGTSIEPNSVSSFNFVKPLPFGSITINEIYADPTPSFGLPAAEYVELFNNTSDTINLQGYSFSDTTSVLIFPNYKFPPNSFLTLCSSAFQSAYAAYGNALGLTSWPSLNNVGDQLILKGPGGNVISRVAYSDTWYGDAIKKDGGWSLELIDPANLCGEENNWSASEDPAGGTPGKVNSLNASKPDLTAPELVKAEVQDSLTIKLLYNEALDTLHIQKANFIIDPFISIREVIISGTDTRSVYLKTENPLAHKILYQITMSGIADCNGNRAEIRSSSFALPEAATAGDLIINEVLFNPRPNGIDFVEIYNTSDKYIDLQGWELANFADNMISNKKLLVTQPFLLKPHDYLFLCTDPLVIKNQYPKARTSSAMTLNSLPSFNDDAGTVILLKDNAEADRFDYNEKFHFALVDDKEGISLERISFTAATNSRDNWHSASTEVYATPGYRNSQAYNGEGQGGFLVEPKVFTPDEDGNKDFTTINYKFSSVGNMVNIIIYDAAGREVKRLVQNQLMGKEGFFQWDGLTYSGEKVRVGYFIIFIEVFNMNGQVKNYKESVVVGSRD